MYPLILYETTSRWSISWRRALRNAGLATTLVETRTPTECFAALAEFREAIVGIEICRENLERFLPQVVDWVRQFPAAIFIAQADENFRPCAQELRAFGFPLLLFSRREIPACLARVRTLQPTVQPATKKRKQQAELYRPARLG